MAQYEAKLDEKLETIAETTIGKNTYRLSIWRYNGGQAKLAVEILFTKADGTEHSRLVTGRWPSELFEFVADNVSSISAALGNYNQNTTTAVASTVNAAATGKKGLFSGVKAKK